MSFIKKADKRFQITDISYVDDDGSVKVIEGVMLGINFDGPPYELLAVFHDTADTTPFMLIRRDRIVKVVLSARIKKELGIE